MRADQTYNFDTNDALMHALKNDGAAFEHFFKLHFASLCTWCQHKYNFDIDIAKEVVHTAFIKLWKNRSTLSADMPVKAFLHKVIMNTSLDILRHAKVRERFERFVQQRNENTGPTPQENYDTKQLQADIDNAISELPDQMRTIFELSRYEGLKYAEIARQLNVSVNTVETQMGRALKKLRIKLAGYLTLFFILMIISCKVPVSRLPVARPYIQDARQIVSGLITQGLETGNRELETALKNI